MKLPRIPYPPSLKGYLLKKYDNLINRLATHAFRRITLNNPGLSYLMELHIQRWNNKLYIPKDIRTAIREKFEQEGTKFDLPTQEERYVPVFNPIQGRYRIWDSLLSDWYKNDLWSTWSTRFKWLLVMRLTNLNKMLVTKSIEDTWDSMKPNK